MVKALQQERKVQLARRVKWSTNWTDITQLVYYIYIKASTQCSVSTL